MPAWSALGKKSSTRSSGCGDGAVVAGVDGLIAHAILVVARIVLLVAPDVRRQRHAAEP